MKRVDISRLLADLEEKPSSMEAATFAASFLSNGPYLNQEDVVAALDPYLKQSKVWIEGTRGGSLG